MLVRSLVCLLQASDQWRVLALWPRLLRLLVTRLLEAWLLRFTSRVQGLQAPSRLTIRLASRALVLRLVCHRLQRSRLPGVRLLVVGLARHLPVPGNSVLLLRAECLRLLRTVLLRKVGNTVLLRQVGNTVAHLQVARADNTARRLLGNTALLPAR